MLDILILRLQQEARSVEKGLCDVPPADYAKFRELVGKRNGFLKVIDIINELTKDSDER